MSQERSPPPRPRGRPPSAVAREKALQAARDILLSEGFGRLSIEAVVAKSGISKPTIYRNWANAGELAMAALMADPDFQADKAKDGLAGSLRAQMHALVTAFATTRGRQIALALAASDPESEMTKAFRNRIILSSREAGRRLIGEAVARGEISAPAELETVLDMIYAPIFYRLLVGHLPLDRQFADSLVTRALALLAL
ncbi:TetR family transcriptional regulator [Prosthecomicrobium hirschii]|uniref:TetR/AcrR family transcriptional regulator n=1 Tax=Prosthecodimorpha hirschii TaxID=665126 RepID=UPI0011299333|nr:TetR/AcrR family transcriptional regulator [Prosthecomicrobium hirschii]TPQ44807.1 TetR family transcriptional regulator [Prosthecomicrobium hirschii]